MEVGGWLRSLGLGQYEELAHLARAGVVKPVHVRSLPAHAIRSRIVEQETVRPAGDLGKPDPWSGGRIRLPGAQPPPSSIRLLEQARGSLVSVAIA